MSQENVKIVRRGFAAWEQGDLEAHLRLIDEDVVTRRMAPLIDAQTYHGLEGYLEFASDWLGPYEAFEFQPSNYIDAGDRVVVEVVTEGRLEGGEQVVKGTFWFLIAVHDGKMNRLEIYGQREHALEAAGLRE